MPEGWSRADRFALIALMVGVLSLVAALIVVPEVRSLWERRAAEVEESRKNAPTEAKTLGTDTQPPVTATAAPSTKAAPVVPRRVKPRTSPAVSLPATDTASSAAAGQAAPPMPSEPHDVMAWGTKRGRFLTRIRIESVKHTGNGLSLRIRVYNDSENGCNFVVFGQKIGPNNRTEDLDDYEIVDEKGETYRNITFGPPTRDHRPGEFHTIEQEVISNDSFVFELEFFWPDNPRQQFTLRHKWNKRVPDEVVEPTTETVFLQDFSIPVPIPRNLW